MKISNSRRHFMTRAGGALLAAAAGQPVWAAGSSDSKVLYVNTWGGSWTAAEDAAFYKPFTAATGIAIRTVEPVSMAQLKEQVRTGTYQWDVSSFTGGDWLFAQSQGLTEPVDWSVVDKTKLFPDALLGTGVKYCSIGFNLVYRTDKFAQGKAPRNWRDFWDVANFPGARALYVEPESALMIALMADGVPSHKLYPLDVDRAFRKLDEIKPHIKVWWTGDSQSQQLLRDGEVDMLLMCNARGSELQRQGVPCEVVWQDAVVISDVWGVAKGSPNAKAAWRFIAFASQPERQAEFAKRLYYGPENPAAYQFLSPEIARQLPSAPANAAVAAQYDAQWHASHYASLQERFTQWLSA